LTWLLHEGRWKEALMIDAENKALAQIEQEALDAVKTLGWD